ncbi:MAG: response regulator [Lautropia sp.]
MIKVVLVDDHTLILRGLRELLADSAGIAVVGEATDYGGLRALLRDTSPSTEPDVIVLDINLPGRSGLEALATLTDQYPRIRTLVLSQYAEEQYGLRALKAGAMGYLNKACEPTRIVQAIRDIAAGRRYVTDELSQLLLTEIGGARPALAHEALSEREMQVMLAIAQGARLSAIALRLSLSPKTVSVYRSRVLQKLSVGGAADIAAYALRHKLIE